MKRIIITGRAGYRTYYAKLSGATVRHNFAPFILVASPKVSVTFSNIGNVRMCENFAILHAKTKHAINFEQGNIKG